MAKVVIDSTGNADVAAPAGAQTVVTAHPRSHNKAWACPHQPWQRLHEQRLHANDDTDLVDIWHLLVYAKEKYSGEFDLGQLVDSGAPPDCGRIRAFDFGPAHGPHIPDTISLGFSDLDTHGYTIDPLLLLSYPGTTDGIEAKLPYRCLLPKGWMPS